jgi:hypothetical protein
MRNDARPIGHDAADPMQGPSEGDARESVTHDRQSHVVNEGAEQDARRRDRDTDPVMPANDSTTRTKI